MWREGFLFLNAPRVLLVVGLVIFVTINMLLESDNNRDASHSVSSIAADNNSTTPTFYNTSRTEMSVDSDKLSFALENLMHGIEHPCGGFKCFYRVKHTYRNRPVGYVAGSKTQLKEILWQAYDFAQELERKYGLQHTMLKAPETIQLRIPFWRPKERHQRQHQLDDLAAFLDTNATERGPSFKRFSNQKQLYVQLVENVLLQDNPALFWGFTDYKQGLAEESMDQFVGFLLQQTRTERQDFVTNLQRNVDELRPVLRKEVCLNNDFQIVIRNTGELVHLDLDRCFVKAPAGDLRHKYKYERHPANFTDAVQKALVDLVQRLADAVLP